MVSVSIYCFLLVFFVLSVRVVMSCTCSGVCVWLLVGCGNGNSSSVLHDPGDSLLFLCLHAASGNTSKCHCSCGI